MEPAEVRYWVVQPLMEGLSWMKNGGFGELFFIRGMGLADYEHPGESLRWLYDRAGGAPVIRAYQITADGTSRPVYFVGPEPGSTSEARELAFCADHMQLWLRAAGVSKVPCWFAEYFHDTTSQVPKSWRPIVAWWAM
jgi:hypothetical protein